MSVNAETLVSIHEEARRERLLDMEDRVRRYRLACFGILALALAIGGGDAVGFWWIPLLGAGHGERFGHGLGHGVGLELHEAPRLSLRSDDVLAPGEVVTVEPGIYLPGRLGVRIEDLVVVAENGLRNLSSLPKALQTVA
ncbi:MAG TPA: M24 family metallopeptidase [Solirubrobacterales bacterium]|nr:M24 family metallopeptidase [Solirubrobacterales bacterium]